MTANAPLRLLTVLLLAAAAATAASPPAPASDRAGLVAEWRAQGLQPLSEGKLDVVYVRPGALGQALAALQVAPVTVEMHPNWQNASRELERARLRPTEVQRIKDDVAAIVADELKQRFPGNAGPDAPVLQARVLDLYVNAPDIETAAQSRTYTRSFGDLVLVAELRDQRDGKLLFAAWERPNPRDYGTLRQTTRVENAIEMRAIAHGWARQLRREFDRHLAGR